MKVTLIHKDGRSFASFGEAMVDWLKNVPHLLEKITVVWREETVISN